MQFSRAGRRGSANGARAVGVVAALLALGGIGVATTVGWAGAERSGTETESQRPTVDRVSTDPPASATPSSTTSVPSSPSPQGQTVVALGDSVTAGSACDCTPFPELYAAALSARGPAKVRAANLGQSGLTTTGLVDQLGGRSTREALSGAARVVVTIGANDLLPLIERRAASGCDASCSQPSVDQMGEGLARALARVRSDDPALQQLLVTTYWNVFEDGDVADALRGPGFADWSDGVTKAANAAICRDAAAASATCVDLYTPFVGTDGQRNPTSLLADDGDHPNAAGHAVVAAALLKATR